MSGKKRRRHKTTRRKKTPAQVKKHSPRPPEAAPPVATRLRADMARLTVQLQDSLEKCTRLAGHRYLHPVYPALSAWIIATYIHLAQYLHMFGIISSKLIPFFFLPVLLLELLASLIWKPIEKRLNVNFTWFIIRWIFSLILRLLFWLGFYYAWVITVANMSQSAQWLKFFAPQFYLMFILVFIGQKWITLITFAVWLLLYYVLTVKWRKLRLLTTMILPMLLGISLFVHLYYFGGTGGLYENKITEQPGVAKIFDPEELDADMVAPPIIRIFIYQVAPHPRGIFFDKNENALFIMFGCTYCEDTVHYPTIVRMDAATGDMWYFVSSNIRKIYHNESSDTMLVAPWYQDAFYELSKHDLSIVKEYPSQTQGLLQYWEPMDLLKSGNYLYVGNDVEQALVAYNLDTGRIEKVLNLYKLGLVKWGGPVWHIVQSEKTGYLYFASGMGENLFEVDPDSFRVLKHKSFVLDVGSALAIDDERGLLYYQHGAFGPLYEIDIDTFEVQRTFRGEGHARRILLDKERNCLYVLGYFSGTVFAIDLDTGQRLWRVRVGGSPHGMDLSDDTLWVNSMAGVFELDLETIFETYGK